MNIITGLCTCGHSKHSGDEPTVCYEIGCKCERFIQATIYSPVISRVDEYMKEFDTYVEKMRWVLEHWRWFRNYTAKDLIFGWWEYVNHWDRKTVLTLEQYKKLGEPESITRARRLLVEENFDRYGPFIPDIEDEKIFKQYAITEYVIMNKK